MGRPIRKRPWHRLTEVGTHWLNANGKIAVQAVASADPDSIGVVALGTSTGVEATGQNIGVAATGSVTGVTATGLAKFGVSRLGADGCCRRRLQYSASTA